MKACIIILAIGLTLLSSPGSDPVHPTITEENLDSLSRSFQVFTKSLTTPEFERRKLILRTYQRRGYVEVLSDVVAEDGLSALLSLLKVNAQIAYHLPHNQLVFHIPPAEIPVPATKNPWHFLAPQSQPWDVPLVQEWSFPADPWGGQ